MKWIGQKIQDVVSRFRNDIYLEGLSSSSETDILVVDSNGKITTNASAGGGGGGNQIMLIDVGDETSNLTTGTAKKTFRIPHNFNVSEIRASVNTAPVGSTIIVDVNQNGTSILNTKLSIDASEETSYTASAAYGIKNPFLLKDDEITVDIDQIGSGTAGKGLKLLIIGTEITAATALYHLSSSSATVDEGSAVTFSMHTFGVTNGTTIAYAITGIAAGDITESLTGNLTVNSNVATQVINAIADMSSESSEVMTMTAQSLTAAVTIVNVNPTYAIARSASTIVEGTSVVFTLNTTGVPNGTTTSYAITGISAGDITGSLTGNFTTNNNTAALTVTAVIDSTVEAGGETMTITAGGATQTCVITDPPTGAPWSESLLMDGVNDYIRSYIAYTGSGVASQPPGVEDTDVTHMVDSVIKTGKNYSFVFNIRYGLNSTPNGDALNWRIHRVANALNWGAWQNYRALGINIYSYGSYWYFRVWHWSPSNPISGTSTKYGYWNATAGPQYGDGLGGGDWGHLTGTTTSNGVWHQLVITKGDAQNMGASSSSGGFGFYLNGFESAAASGYLSGLANNGDIGNGFGDATWDLAHASNSGLSSNAWSTQIGANGTYKNSHFGSVAFYDKELSQSEIDDIYDGGARAGGSADQDEIMNQDLTGKTSSGNLRHYWYLDSDGEDGDDDTGTVLLDKVGGCDMQLYNTTIETATNLSTPQIPYFDSAAAPPSVYNGESATLTQGGSSGSSTVTWYSDSNRTVLINTGTTYTYTPSSVGAVTHYIKDTNGANVQTGEMAYTVATPGYSTHSFWAGYDGGSRSLEGPYNSSTSQYDRLQSGSFTSGKFSFTFWFCPSLVKSNNSYIIQFDNYNYFRWNISGSNYPHLQCRINNQWQQVYGNNGSEGSSVTNWVDPVNKWKCLTFTFDPTPGTIKLFTNGEKVQEVTHSNIQYDMIANTPGLKIQLANNVGSVHWMDNIALYNDVLTDAEAIAVQGGAGTDTVGRSVNLEVLSGSSSKLIDYWKMQGDDPTNTWMTGINGTKLKFGYSAVSALLSTVRP
jgi:hypothetical protein